VAEHSGLIVDVGDWVLEETCRQIARWRAELGVEVPPTAVNISARQLRDPGIVSRIAGLLERYDLDASRLTLELTETLVMERGTGEATLVALHDLGLRIALDDFGTGHSSLSRLHGLPIDTLKIDRAFVSQLHDPERGEAIAAAIVAMADTLGLRVVAEGVETHEQLEILRRLGCTYAQGFLLGRPVPAVDYAAHLR
jgi:EAL domain-containing protein (putative c-di-GMP-specific phosphodiesterase class I)